jgi:hypothetical protein
MNHFSVVLSLSLKSNLAVPSLESQSVITINSTASLSCVLSIGGDPRRSRSPIEHL